MTTIDKLIARAVDTTRAWIVENWHRPIGTPEEILDNLIHYDDEFFDLWQQLCEERGWDDEVDADEPDIKLLLFSIGQTHDTSADMEEVIKEGRKSFGDKLRMLRESAGLTQTELAERSGLKRNNISRIESGRYNVTLDTMTRLSTALGEDLI